MTRYAEKRDLLRLPIDCELRYSQRGNERQYIGHVINFSGKGILFTSNRALDEGVVLEIVLTPSNSQTEPMNALVVVTRVSHNEAIYEIACEIEEIA